MFNALVPAMGKVIVAGSIAGAIIIGHPMAQAMSPNEDEPGWNCSTMGNRICGTQPVSSGIAGSEDSPLAPYSVALLVSELGE